MGSRWLIRRFRTGPQSEPRGHFSSTRSPVAGVALASEGVRSVSPVTPALHGGAEDSRAAERQRPIRTWSARAIAPPPGSPGATTDTDRPHGRRVRQTSLPRHSSCRSTERPFRFLVDHTVRPRPAVPSREGTPAGHDQHRRPARPAVGLSPRLRRDRSADRFPLAPLRNGVAWPCGVDERGAAGTLSGAAQGRRIPDPVPSASGPADRGHSSGTTPCRRSWSCRNSTGSGGTRCRNRLPGPRPRSCSSRSASWICPYWRLSSCPEASGVTASAPANTLPTEDAVK